MLRRVLALVLAAVGATGLLAAPSVIPVSSVRNSVLVLLVGGLLLCNVAVLRRHLALRPTLRWLSLAVALIFAAGAAAIRYRVAMDALPLVPDADFQLRASLTDWVRSLPWLAGALVYVGLSIVVLPGAKRTLQQGETGASRDLGD
jgi:hypothetical protein